MSPSLDHRRIQQLVAEFSERLDGDWLLVGGALVAFWLDTRRVTEDIDLIGLANTGRERLALMQVAEDLALPIEAVNSAADFFVRRIPRWQSEIEILVRGSRATIYRPTPTLFLLLKIGRLSERDLADCLAVIALSRAERMPLDDERVCAAMDNLDATADKALASRRKRLRKALVGAEKKIPARRRSSR